MARQSAVWATSAYLLKDGTPPLTGAPMSVSAWGYTPASGADSDSLFCLGDSGVVADRSQFNLRISTSLKPVWQTTNPAGGYSEAIHGTSVPTNTWYHVCGVELTTSSRQIYLNGVAGTADTSACVPTNVNRMIIGAQKNLAQGFSANGRLAHIALWNVALSVDEIGELAAGASPLLVRPQSLQCYWPLWGDLDASERDLVGGYTMTKTGVVDTVDEPRIFYARHMR